MNNFHWAILFRSNNKLEGYREHIVSDHKDFNLIGPKLFPTRKGARAWCKDRYGYIKIRDDLRREPHGWKPAKVVKVRLHVEIL